MATNNTFKQFADLDLSFAANPFTKDIYLKTDEDAVKTALKHLLRTENFERPFHPEIGTQIRSLMFEQFSSAIKIAMELSRLMDSTATNVYVHLEIADSVSVFKYDLLPRWPI
jgi:hypothetical protein